MGTTRASVATTTASTSMFCSSAFRYVISTCRCVLCCVAHANSILAASSTAKQHTLEQHCKIRHMIRQCTAPGSRGVVTVPRASRAHTYTSLDRCNIVRNICAFRCMSTAFRCVFSLLRVLTALYCVLSCHSLFHRPTARTQVRFSDRLRILPLVLRRLRLGRRHPRRLRRQ